MTAPGADATVALTLTNGADTPLNINWGLYDALGNNTGDLTGYAAPSNTTFQLQDGFPSGVLRGITVDEDARPDGEFGKMHLPGGKCAVGSFKVKPHQFGEAWDAVCRWLADSGYQPADGLPFEFYPEEHTDENPPTFTVDICVPVMPL